MEENFGRFAGPINSVNAWIECVVIRIDLSTNMCVCVWQWWWHCNGKIYRIGKYRLVNLIIISNGALKMMSIFPSCLSHSQTWIVAAFSSKPVLTLTLYMVWPFFYWTKRIHSSSMHRKAEASILGWVVLGWISIVILVNLSSADTKWPFFEHQCSKIHESANDIFIVKTRCDFLTIVSKIRNRFFLGYS